MQKFISVAVYLLLMTVFTQSIYAQVTDESSVNLNSSSSASGVDNGHVYVDLGLPSGVKWATCNVGADKPEAYGNYFAWGEVKTKKRFYLHNYKWLKINGITQQSKLKKYCMRSEFGKVDGKMVLEPEDDVAHVQWGGLWRMPTIEDLSELINNTTSEWVENYNGTGACGAKIIATNGNHIFLPVAGGVTGKEFLKKGESGYYWTSSIILGSDINAPIMVVGKEVTTDKKAAYAYYMWRVAGFTVRPVHP